MAVKLYVGNLSYEMTESDLTDLFSPYGAVENVKIVADRFTGKPRGFGFVELPSQTEAERAIQELNGKSIRNRNIVVSEARPPSPRRDFDRPRSRSGGRGGGRPGRY